MHYRPLGPTGLRVSEIGFGTWGLGGDAYGPTDDAVSRAVLRLAFDAGITFYDTSDLYGAGHSEAVLGEALHDVRDRVVIASKVGLLPHTGFSMPSDFSPRHLREGLEASLRRLRTDYLDLYQLHSPTLADLRQGPELVPTLEALKQAGKIRAFGLSARSPADALAAVQEFGFEVVQVNFNLIDQRAAECGLLELAVRRPLGVIARTPLCFGYLTGALDGQEVFAGRDHRAHWPATQRHRWASASGLFAFLNAHRRRTPAQLALRFCLDHPGIATVIPGMLKAEEVRENLAASGLEPLTATERDRIRAVYRSHEFYDPGAKRAAQP